MSTVGPMVMSVQEERLGTQCWVLHTSGQEEGTGRKLTAQRMTVLTNSSSLSYL